MLSYWPGVPVVSMASARGDGFLSAATKLWEIKFPELGGLGPMLTTATLGAFSLHPAPNPWPAYSPPSSLSLNTTNNPP